MLEGFHECVALPLAFAIIWLVVWAAHRRGDPQEPLPKRIFFGALGWVSNAGLLVAAALMLIVLIVVCVMVPVDIVRVVMGLFD